MPLRSEDRCVWIGDPETRPTGSSGKVRTVSKTGKTALVSWGGGEDTICRIGKEVITVRQAYNRKIPPWERVFDPLPPSRGGRAYNPPSIFGP